MPMGARIRKDAFGHAQVLVHDTDRAAELNGGSYVGITKENRAAVNREVEAFVLACINQRTSFVYTG